MKKTNILVASLLTFTLLTAFTGCSKNTTADSSTGAESSKNNQKTFTVIEELGMEETMSKYQTKEIIC